MAEYDGISLSYHESKQLPFRDLERAAFLGAVGDVRGLRVLDLACGTGFYTRLLKKAGAATAVGVDISHEMILLAEREEAAAPVGVRYVQADAKEVDVASLGGPFDLVVCTYLLNYARTRAELRAMLEAVRRAVAGRGRVVGLNDNPHQREDDFAASTPYGFVKERIAPSQAPRADGDVVVYRFDFASPSQPDLRHRFHFENVWFSPATYAEVAHEVGFAAPTWVPLPPPPAATQAERDYWQDWTQMAERPITCFVLEPLPAST